MDDVKTSAIGYELDNVVDGRTTTKTYYRVALHNDQRLAVGRPFLVLSPERAEDGSVKGSGRTVDVIAVKVHVEYDNPEFRSAVISARADRMGMDGGMNHREAYFTGFAFTQLCYADDANRELARKKNVRSALRALSEKVIEQAKSSGSAVVCEAPHVVAFLVASSGIDQLSPDKLQEFELPAKCVWFSSEVPNPYEGEE